MSLSSVVNFENSKSISLMTLIPMLRALQSFDLLYDFTKDEKISPITYARMLDGLKKRKRVSATRKEDEEITPVSEWLLSQHEDLFSLQDYQRKAQKRAFKRKKNKLKKPIPCARDRLISSF